MPVFIFHRPHHLFSISTPIFTLRRWYGCIINPCGDKPLISTASNLFFRNNIIILIFFIFCNCLRRSSVSKSKFPFQLVFHSLQLTENFNPQVPRKYSQTIPRVARKWSRRLENNSQIFWLAIITIKFDKSLFIIIIYMYYSCTENADLITLCCCFRYSVPIPGEGNALSSRLK